MLPRPYWTLPPSPARRAPRKSSSLSSALNGKNRRTRRMRDASVMAIANVDIMDRLIVARFHEAFANADRNVFRIPNQLRLYCLIPVAAGFLAVRGFWMSSEHYDVVIYRLRPRRRHHGAVVWRGPGNGYYFWNGALICLANAKIGTARLSSLTHDIKPTRLGIVPTVGPFVRPALFRRWQ